MLKIYNSYYMYQLDHGEWNRFGYTGWFCKEESDVTDLKIILKDATFEQAFERFEKKPDHNIFSSRTFISRDEVFAKVKQLNKRRKKLYDSEYVTEVCSRFHLNPAEIVAGLKDRFGTYRRFYDYIHKG